MYTSEARVATSEPDRYAKQLASHLGRKIEVRDEPGGVRLVLPAAECLVSTVPGALLLQASASDPAALAEVQDVVGRHLERFGRKVGLLVSWG